MLSGDSGFNPLDLLTPNIKGLAKKHGCWSHYCSESSVQNLYFAAATLKHIFLHFLCIELNKSRSSHDESC